MGSNVHVSCEPQAVLAFHLKACEFFGHCNSSSNPATAPQLFRIEPEHDLGNPDPASYDWLAAHPNVKEAMACLTPHPAPHILNAELRGQVRCAQAELVVRYSQQPKDHIAQTLVSSHDTQRDCLPP